MLQIKKHCASVLYSRAASMAVDSWSSYKFLFRAQESILKWKGENNCICQMDKIMIKYYVMGVPVFCWTINHTRQAESETGPKTEEAADRQRGSGVSEDDAERLVSGSYEGGASGVMSDIYNSALIQLAHTKKHTTVSNYLPSIFQPRQSEDGAKTQRGQSEDWIATFPRRQTQRG